MAVTRPTSQVPTPQVPPGQPLPCVFEAKAQVSALVVDVDREEGLGVVRIALAERPDVRVFLAPDVALDLAAHLISVVRDLETGEPRR
jgi:hypothetical protein